VSAADWRGGEAVPAGAGRITDPAAASTAMLGKGRGRNAFPMTLRALAALLGYPDPDLVAHGADVLDAVRNEAVLPKADIDALATLVEALASEDLLDVQARYVDTFDRGRQSALHLFEHVHGESRDRGQAMVDLQGMYLADGVVQGGNELPDYLPAYLEWLSLRSAAAAREGLRDVAHLMLPVGRVLTRRQSPWAVVFVALLRLAGERSPRALLATDPQQAPDDRTAAALDKVWAEEPVTFMDACPPQSGKPTEQIIKFHRGART
jgi:nitrate reductase molybdenum cofactor assembly chaperone NarJ/NarW